MSEKKRPDRTAVMNAVRALVEADAISDVTAYQIVFDAGYVAGVDVGESREKARAETRVNGEQLARIISAGRS